MNWQLPARASSIEPSPKRKKSEPFNDVSTINGRANAGVYSSLEDVLNDVNTACVAILGDLCLPNGSARTQYTPISPDDAELASRISIFRQNTERMIQVQKVLYHRKSSIQRDGAVDTAIMTNGNVSKTITQLTPNQGANKMVLTLFGNAAAAGPKQLFSSLQESIKTFGGMKDVMQPLREAGLPNGISTTQIVPIHSGGAAEEKKPAPTLGELFTSPTSGLPFQPPKPSRVTTTRATVVGWYQPNGLDAVRTRSTTSYFGQTISAGQWLDYTGALTSVDPKRKQRERALSLGGVKSSMSSTDLAEQENLKLEALFRSAYSGFAPYKDDAVAIVPAGLSNRMWWQRNGRRNFDRLVRNTATIEAIVNPYPNPRSEQTTGRVEELDDETEEFKQVVDSWDDEAIDPDLLDVPTPIEDKDVNEILKDISESLETLNSYQRIRNSSLNQLRPTSAISSGDSVSTSTKPTENEIAAYHTLKAQLTLMISLLPPYAVAKLNSDQLSELGISTKITLYTDSHRGVMEEDEAAARAKVAEMRAATNSRTAPATAIHRSSTSLYGNQYSSTPRPSTQTGQQFYPQTQAPIRPPSTNPQRPASNAHMPYTSQRPQSSTPYRPQPTYSTPSYSHQIPRNAQAQHTQPSSQFFQTPTVTSYAQSLTQSYNSVQISTPQTNLGTRYQPPAPSLYQQRSQPQKGLEYRYNNGNSSNHQPSPPKTQAYSPQPHPVQLQNRSFGTPTPTMAQDRRYFQPAIANGTASVSPQPQTTQQQTQSMSTHLGATGYHTVMTAEQQSTMMERQRAQLAQQQGTQHQARNAAQAGALSVPSVPQVNGGSPVPASL